ncbi:Rpn family recombination-promoting nuclease/putative transposase [Nannocystaceae bacterium ST9]
MTTRPHDALFKNTFERPEDAAALARCHLEPSLSAVIDWPTMRLESGSFVDEDDLVDRHSDLLFMVETEVGATYLYLLFEHQSTDDPRMPLRMLTYMVRIWQRHAKLHEGPLPAIIPLLICHAPGGWSSPRHFHELFTATLEGLPGLARFVPAFALLVDDLAHVSNEELKARALAGFAKLALWMLRDARMTERLMASLPAWAEAFAEAAQTPRGLEALRGLFYYLTLVNEGLPWDEFHAKLQELAPAAGKVSMTIAEQLINKGRAEGLAEGRVEGLVEGRASLLAKLLALKFGELPEPLRIRLASANVDELDTWAERVLRASSLDQVFAD